MPLTLFYLISIGLLLIVTFLYLLVRVRNRQQQNTLTRVDRWLSRMLPLDHSAVETFVPTMAVRELMVLLLVGGLLLVWMGLSIYRVVTPTEALWVGVLSGLGVLFFLFAGQTAVSQKMPGWLIRPLTAVGRYFALHPWQVVSLLMAVLFAWMARLAAGDRLVAYNAAISIAAWLASLILLFVGGYERRSETAVTHPMRRWEWVAVGLLFALALALRAYNTTEFPANFSGDEGSASLAAVEFAQGNINNLFTTGWFSFPSFYFWIQSLGIDLLGRTVPAVRLISALAGALAVVATFWLARSLFDRQTAVFSAFYLAVSHYHIHMSRLALNNIWDSFFGALAIYGFWDGWHTGRRNSYLWCGFSLGLGLYFYVSVRVLPVLFLLWAAFALLRHPAKFWQRLPGMILAGWVSLVTFLPLGLYFYKFPNEFQAPLNRVAALGEWLEAAMAAQNQTAVQVIAGQMWLATKGYVIEPLQFFYDPGAPLLLTAAATLFLVGLLWGVWHFDLRYLLIGLPLVAAIISNGLSQSTPAAQRYVLAIPFVAVFIGVPLGQMARWIDQYWPEQRWLAVLITGVLMASVSVQDVRYYFVDIKDTFVFGGNNTLLATEIAEYLQHHPTSGQTVYFFGFPRMGYYSLSTIPYLAETMRGQDVVDPLGEPPLWSTDEPSLFIFLPERAGELRFVKETFPEGEERPFVGRDGMPLFTAYEINQPAE